MSNDIYQREVVKEIKTLVNNIVYVLIIIYTVNIYFDKSKFNYRHREEWTGVWVCKRVCTYIR